MNFIRPVYFLSAPFKVGLGLALCGAAFTSSAIAPRAQAEDVASSPRVLILPAQSDIFVGGDCNNASVWVKDQLRVYASPYPLNGFPGGAAWYSYGPTVQNLQGATGVNPDRSVLSQHLPSAASGPWFESVIADHEGNLFAYYHGEYITPDGLKIHPRLGSQVSHDGGTTWQDLGIVIDTPVGTDESASHLQYGFDGGNGDCSAILDETSTYLYFFFSQYGASAENQGIAVARMLWSDRASPAGKVMKWHLGAWSEAGLGGQATPVLNNIGDAHELRAACDFWWGPSIHWNTHLHRYVILLNRSNTTGFTASGIPANWYMTGASLADPTTWTNPQPLSFPDGFNGDWYPQVIGIDHLQTDRLAGRVARLFVAGVSRWKIYFLLPNERTPLAGENSAPVVAVPVSNQNAVVNHPFSSILSWGTFSDSDGDPLTWTVNGLPSWLSFDTVTHNLSGTPTSGDFGQTASITVAATDASGLSTSARFLLTVTELGAVTASTMPSDLRPKLQITVGSGASDLEVLPGTTLTITGRATDANGDMSQHWLEIRNPAGAWSWEGWLTSEPWNAALGGNGFESVKSTSFTFNETGDYYVRTTAIDPDGDWVISSDVHVRVGASAYPSVQVSVNGAANHLTVVRGETVAIAGRATDHEGDLSEHWLEIQNPEGAWSWEGWLTGEPWSGALGGDSYTSAKSNYYTFDRAGTFTVRSTAIDVNGKWIISSLVNVTVVDR